jgi:hypothetical protein
MMVREEIETDTKASITFQSRNKEKIFSMSLSLKLIVLILITLLTRLLIFLKHQIITNDGMLYVQMAKLFSEGKYEGIASSYFNLYPLMLSFVQKFIGDWELSGQLISITLGTLTVVPIFLLGRSLYNEKVGWLSALFYIILPNFLKFDTNVLRDPTYWFFMAFTLWLVWDGLQKKQLALLGLASISAGLGAMTRVEGFIIWGALVFYIAFRKINGISLKRKALHIVLLIIIFPLLISPILFFLKKQSSQIALGEMASFSFKSVAANVRVIFQPKDPIHAMGERAYKSLPNISKDSLELASRHRVILGISEVIYKFIKSANLLIILILLGIWRRKRDGFETSDWYLFYIFAALFGMSMLYTRQIYYFSTRHGLTLVLLCLFFSAHGMTAITDHISRKIDQLASRWKIMKKYTFHLLIFFLVVIFLAQGFSTQKTEKYYLKEIGLWLRDNGHQGSVIMGPDKFFRIAFYSNGKFLEMPDSLEKILASIRKNGVRLVIIDSCTMEQDYPGFRTNWIQAGFTPLQKIESKKEKCEIQIYKVQ